MPQQEQNWTAIEDNTILDLVSSFKFNFQINWAKLAFNFNQKFAGRTGEECKSHYFKDLKPVCPSPKNTQWTKDQLADLAAMYIRYGSSWVKISQNMNMSQSTIKNRFYWGLNKGAQLLDSHIKRERKQKGGVFQRTVHCNVLNTLLDLCNQIQRWACQKGLTINQQSQSFILRRKVVEYCFFMERFTRVDTDSLVKEIKVISSQLKAYKLFKVDNRRKFKVDEQFIRRMFSFDKFVKEESRLAQLLKEQEVTSTKENQIERLQQENPFKSGQQDLQSLSLPLSYDMWMGQLKQLGNEYIPNLLNLQQISWQESFLNE